MIDENFFKVRFGWRCGSGGEYWPGTHKPLGFETQ